MHSCVFKDPQDIRFSNHFATKYAKWSEDEANMLHSMYCCAFCGVTDWGGQSANQAGFRMVDPVKTNPARPDEDVPDALQIANNPSADEGNDVREAAKDEHVPLYALSNYRLRQHMQCEDSMKNQKWWQWRQCRGCKEPGTRAAGMKQVALMPPEYQEMLLQADPLEMQTFTSLLDATLDIKERVHGYSKTKREKAGLWPLNEEGESWVMAAQRKKVEVGEIALPPIHIPFLVNLL
ncbi:hypothetical protein CEUSTIGMA_g12083.t1 [Chlamydomonas eustigma]|uniref:Uncharacterized protein n=1 Tax=Chlamydomonas eustigma TaxID=1157962 RepID=A0A250XP09_9CHLO|nr:hypothetical protein CEUSTIGMA_g12083.t1 [Chlamydomonas eustigma]|eukprot:GAX84662.1 hypothetical protein CEUSTIGMA_g12083.t1 [Chlamydomonas eustigma]